MLEESKWQARGVNYKPLVEIGRRPLHLEKTPNDLDFSKTIGGTIYVVKSGFNKSARECLLKIIARWVDEDKILSE